jgi:hypothetical protein
MALLRGKIYLEFPAVLSFLEIWNFDSSAVKVAQLGLDETADTGALAGDHVTTVPKTKAVGLLQQEVWRRLFVSLRVRVKPHEIGVRCRLFEGVVSGAEVFNWVASNGYSTTESFEIGQRLINCGLLVKVCSGYDSAAIPDPAHVVLDAKSLTRHRCTVDDEMSINSLHRGGFTVVFSNQPGYLYTFQQKIATSFAVGKFVLFGTTITATVIQWFRDESAGFTCDDSGQVVKYSISCQHGGDDWKVLRRYREFAELHKQLLMRGIKSIPLPPKAPFRARAAQTQEELDQRRVGLNAYMSSVLESVVQSQLPEAQVLLASFLDDEFDSLVIH